ncbi:serine/threonine protein kinase [Saprolegnia diclina VS20]|uniref:Serine/threonine protein kinase n=1 Tax=Saprolegnia diclina (strain VS20) TaxID=1156394 RepID=T0RK68_SAPDV|nr:serine/threonine protein kinase [Saprolegnia diclina VS20]EQC30342.1 serine/threonine protein kinase [Saprolegnia diclina VS20]|eukprot:XP_008616195.1 serine/threonine protein kinase [Saprolegnia diclina VS20]
MAVRLWATSEDLGAMNPDLAWYMTIEGGFFYAVHASEPGYSLEQLKQLLRPVLSLRMTFLATIDAISPFTLPTTLFPRLRHAEFVNVSSAALLAPFTNNGAISSMQIADSNLPALDLSRYTNLSTLTLITVRCDASPIVLPTSLAPPRLAINMTSSNAHFASLGVARAYALNITTDSVDNCRALQRTSFEPSTTTPRCLCVNTTLVCPTTPTIPTPPTIALPTSGSASSLPSTAVASALSTGAIVGVVLGALVFLCLLISLALYYRRQHKTLKAHVWASNSNPSSPNEAYLEVRSPHQRVISLVASLPDPCQVFRDAFPDFTLPLEKEKTSKLATSRSMRLCYSNGAKLALFPIKVTASDKAAFIQRVQMLRDLPPHRHLVALLGVSVINFRTEFAVAVQFADRGSLAHALHHGPPVPAPLEMAHGIASGLAALHAQTVCFDGLTPHRVLVDKAFTCLLDTLHLLRTPHHHHNALVSFGSDNMAYMAPEVLRGEPTTVAADVYALGMLLGEIWTRTRPYTALLTGHGFVHCDMVLLAAARDHVRVPPFDMVSHAGVAAVVAMCTVDDVTARPTAEGVADVLVDLVRASEASSSRLSSSPHQL